MHKAIKMYLDNTPIKEIVKETGISRTRLYQEINMLDIKRGWKLEPKHTKLTKYKIAEVQYLLNIGFTQEKIGMFYGVTQGSVNLFLKKHNLKREV